MTISRHYVGKLCDCGNRNVITHTPTRIAMTKNEKDDFVPLASVLEDYAEADSSAHKSGNNNCCIHGVPCPTGSRTSSSSSRRSKSSSSCDEAECEKLGSASIRKRIKDSNSRSSSVRRRLTRSHSPTTMKEKAYQKVRYDQKSGPYYAAQSVKTRWPLTELLADCSLNNSPQTSSHQLLQNTKKAFYDLFSDAENDENTKSLGRRKDKKKKYCNEKYPKLESVLEDTGYIEFSRSQESSPRSYGQPSARRKSKKTRRNSNSALLNLPYADVAYLKEKLRGKESSRSRSCSSGRSSGTVLSEEEFVAQASDLELICRYYLGHRTLNEAENGKYFADSCYFYHLLPNFKGDFSVLPKCVRLFALYVTPTKKFKHYAVIKYGDEYCVECDEKRRFSSINELVRFYALNKCFNGHDGNKQRFPSDD